MSHLTLLPSVKASPVRLAPMATLRRLAARLRLSTPTHRLEAELIDHQITRELTALRGAEGQAVEITTNLDQLRQNISRALTDRYTPGIIDETEAAALVRDLLTTATHASAHRQHLAALQ
jgi:hypothetical protein